MSAMVITKGSLAPVDARTLNKIQAVENYVGQLPQVQLLTEQVLHAGCYARTILVPKGVTMTGALIQIPTLLIISGHMLINNGDMAVEINGYQVLEGTANRKQVAIAIEDTYMTMIFATDAKTTEEAENEFTPEAERLQTRRRLK